MSLASTAALPPFFISAAISAGSLQEGKGSTSDMHVQH
jgi:hypothetical protein